MGGLLDRQSEPVPQQHGLALHDRQLLERLEHRRPLLDRERLARGRVVSVEPRPLAAPRAAVLVDVRADDDLPDVGLLAAVAVQPRPRDVQLHERGLQQVLGLVPVTADGVRDPAQVGPPGRDELGELRVAVAASHRLDPASPPSALARGLGLRRHVAGDLAGLVLRGVRHPLLELGRRPAVRELTHAPAGTRTASQQNPLPFAVHRDVQPDGVLRRGTCIGLSTCCRTTTSGPSTSSPSAVRVTSAVAAQVEGVALLVDRGRGARGGVGRDRRAAAAPAARRRHGVRRAEDGERGDRGSHAGDRPTPAYAPATCHEHVLDRPVLRAVPEGLFDLLAQQHVLRLPVGPVSPVDTDRAQDRLSLVSRQALARLPQPAKGDDREPACPGRRPAAPRPSVRPLGEPSPKGRAINSPRAAHHLRLHFVRSICFCAPRSMYTRAVWRTRPCFSQVRV